MGERTAEDRKVEGSTPSRGIFMKVYRNLSAADSFSMLNALFGISSIFLLFLSSKWYAFVFIMLAILADGMDGIMARRYGSSIGVIDEFADMISFVASPTIIAFATYGTISVIFLYGYVIASIIHLLNYHYSEKDHFIGLPTPAAALAIGTASVLAIPFWAFAFLTTIVIVLLASPLKYVRIEGIARAIAAITILITIILGEHEIFLILLLIFNFIYMTMGSLMAYLER